jgi:DNA-binding SARP family transcriptional activator
MMRLSLSLLGPFQATLDGAPAVFATDRARALLAYLAVEADRPHRREALADLLWPDRPEPLARQNLSQTLARLRRAIDDHHADLPFLHITPKAIQFNAATADLDVARFQDAMRSAASHPHPGLQNCQDCAKRLEQAADLYRGDFLQGLSVSGSLPFEEWVLVEREQLHRQALEALHALAAHYSTQQAYYEAQRYTERQLALEPWRESAHRQLMRALALSGQRSAALAQYHTCAQVLAEELDVEPAAETTALYEQIRQGTLRPMATTPTGSQTGPHLLSAPPPVPSLPPASVRAPRRAAAFVGRERELARLDHLLASAMAGQGRVALIAGEAGSGRTALAHEFARRAQETHASLVVAAGRCDVHSGLGDPYLPFREILSLLTGEIEAPWAAGTISQENAGRLWSLARVSIPALVERSPDLIDRLVPGRDLLSRAAVFGLDRFRSSAGNGRGGWAQLERQLTPGGREPAEAPCPQASLHEQFAALIQDLAAQRPLVLLLDDLQWADAPSIDLFFHLSRHLSRSRILLLATYRPEDVAVGWNDGAHPLQSVIGELGRNWGEIQVSLDRRTGDEGRRFVDALLDEEPNRLGEDFRRTLFRLTGGHALFTVELLRDLQECGDLRLDDEGRWIEGPALNWERLPTRVEAVIERRLGRLPDHLRRALRVASVEGEEFTAETVARVLGLSEGAFIRQLSAIAVRRHRLLTPPSLQWLGSQHLSRYRFRHSLFQRHLYQTQDEAERRVLHQAVGNTLESLYGDQADEVAVQLARHFEAAGHLSKAADYRLQAGQRARRRSADDEALRHIRQGLALVEDLPEGPGRAQRERSMRLALGKLRAAHNGNGIPEAVEAPNQSLEPGHPPRSDPDSLPESAETSPS